MSAKELRRSEVLSRVKRGELKLSEAAELLEISYRQVKRLKKRYGEGGTKALVHGNVGRTSNRADHERRQQVLELVREHYSGEPHERFGPTLASEHLAADHGLEVPRETLRRWMLAAGLWSRRRKRKPHRTRRQRKAHFGELIQLDGSHHNWLAGRGPQACLMNFVDDATGFALCRFSDEETTWAAADLLEAWVRQHGVPKALYCDWKNVYQRKPTSREALEGIEPETQFGRSQDGDAELGTHAPELRSLDAFQRFPRPVLRCAVSRTRKRPGQQPICSKPGCVNTAFRRRCTATGKTSTSASRRRGKRWKASSQRRSSGACVPSSASPSWRRARRKPRDVSNVITARTKIA